MKEAGLIPAAPRRMVRAVVNYYYCHWCDKYWEDTKPMRRECACPWCREVTEPYYVDGEGKKS